MNIRAFMFVFAFMSVVALSFLSFAQTTTFNFNSLTSNVPKSNELAVATQTFNVPYASYLLVIMFIGIGYYATDHDMLRGLLAGLLVDALLLVFGLLFNVLLIDIYFSSVLTIITIFYIILVVMKKQ